MICALDVNALGFCSAAVQLYNDEILLAAPSLTDEKSVDLYTLPSCKRLVKRVMPDDVERKLGMVMCLDLQYPILVVAYEDGSVAWLKLNIEHVDRNFHEQNGSWETIGLWRKHRDAVLGIKINMTDHAIYSSGIDSMIVRYNLNSKEDPISTNTKHSGQQSLVLRSDNKLIATSGWDGSIRLYSARKCKRLAVLQWHKLSVQCVQFRKVDEISKDDTNILAAGSDDCKITIWKAY